MSKSKNLINRESTDALWEVLKQKTVTPLDVISFWRKYGILIPTKKKMEKLMKE